MAKIERGQRMSVPTDRPLRRVVPVVLFAAMAILGMPPSASDANAADNIVLGKKMVVRQTSTGKRVVVGVGVERDTDIGTGPGLPAGDDPLANGAALTVVANGAQGAVQTFDLAAGAFAGSTTPGWKETKAGYVYRDRQGLAGPVRKIVLSRSTRGTFVLRIVIKGVVEGGEDPTAVVVVRPPDPGTDAGVILEVNGGNRYCMRLGDAASGEIRRDDDKAFVVASTRNVGAVEAGCSQADSGTTTTLEPSTTTSTMESTTTTIASTTTTTVVNTTTTTIVSTTTTPSTTTTSLPGGPCGNGQLDGGETCDDGNASNNDACPSDCVIDACTPIVPSSVPFEVHFAPPAGAVVGGITVLLDHPEGKVHIPGPPIPGGIITNLPPGAFAIPVHLQHALRETVAISGILPPGRLFRVNFRACTQAGGVPPLATEFGCTVLEATDNLSNPVSGVTCTVQAP